MDIETAATMDSPSDDRWRAAVAAGLLTSDGMAVSPGERAAIDASGPGDDDDDDDDDDRSGGDVGNIDPDDDEGYDDDDDEDDDEEPLQV